MITPILVNGGNLNPHPIGAYYMYMNKWSVFNVDAVQMNVGAKFKVEYHAEPGPDRSPSRSAIFDREEYKVPYDAATSKWFIAKINGTPVPSGSAFNVVFSAGGSSGIVIRR